MDVFQIQNINKGELLGELQEMFKGVAQMARPDRLINTKRAALIFEHTPRTIHNWLKNGTLTNHAKENENPKISLYELLTIIDKKNGQTTF